MDPELRIKNEKPEILENVNEGNHFIKYENPLTNTTFCVKVISNPTINSATKTEQNNSKEESVPKCSIQINHQENKSFDYPPVKVKEEPPEVDDEEINRFQDFDSPSNVIIYNNPINPINAAPENPNVIYFPTSEPIIQAKPLQKIVIYPPVIPEIKKEPIEDPIPEEQETFVPDPIEIENIKCEPSIDIEENEEDSNDGTEHDSESSLKISRIEGASSYLERPE